MATATVTPSANNTDARLRRMNWHGLFVTIAVACLCGLVAALAIRGAPYYLASQEQRPLSPLHLELRSSGTVGIRLGMLGVAMFCILFLYPLRKRWKWLGTIGRTGHWLDFHVLMGIFAPLIITFHSAFKARGLAGVAYWIMVLVALSGFIGRYIYAKIPRSLKAVRFSMEDLHSQTQELANRLAGQSLFSPHDLAPLLGLPAPSRVKDSNIFLVLFTLLWLDVTRPFLVSGLRRRVLNPWQVVLTLGGLRASHNRELELVIAGVRRQARLCASIAFLERTERVFHLWHVIHRPFSLTFVALIVIHIGVVISMGYF